MHKLIAGIIFTFCPLLAVSTEEAKKEEMDPALQTTLTCLPVMVNSLLNLGTNKEASKDPRVITQTFVTLFTGMVTIFSELFRSPKIESNTVDENDALRITIEQISIDHESLLRLISLLASTIEKLAHDGLDNDSTDASLIITKAHEICVRCFTAMKIDELDIHSTQST